MHRLNYGWLLVSIFIFSLFWNLGSWGVTESSEARYAEISREMLKTRNWTLPQYLQILHFDKPLMTYWVTAMGLKIFGINAFAVRFFLQIAFLFQIYLVFRISLELFENKKMAIYAAILYSGIPLVLISIRSLTTDAYLTTFTLLASLCYIYYYKKQSIRWLYAFFICLGLAIFTKGPIGILLPLLLIYPVHQILKPKETGGSKSHHFYIGILISLAIGGWWFFQLMVSSTGFYDFFVNHQIIDRVANAETFKRSKPFWYYFAFLPLFILPMLSLFIGSLISVFKGNLKSIKGMIVICILLPLLLFSISSSKLILYILPIMPYIALAMAYFLHHLEDRKVRTHLYFACVVYFLIISTILVLSLNLIPSISYTLSLPQFILWVLLLAYLSLGLLKVKENKNKIMLLFLIFPLFILPISTNILKRFELEINSTVPVTEFIKKSQLESQQILVWNRAVNSIPFQLDKTIYSLKYKHYSLNRNTLFQPDSQWKNNLININSEEGKAQVSALIRLPSVLISADKIPEEYNWLLTSFKNRKQLGKWIVYYNNL